MFVDNVLPHMQIKNQRFFQSFIQVRQPSWNGYILFKDVSKCGFL